MTHFPARLLVDLPNWLGDIIHAAPPLRTLIAANHGGRTVALAPAAYVPLLGAAGVEAFERPPGASWRWARRTLAGRFDVAVTLRHSTRAKLLLAGSTAPVALASAGRGAAALGLATFPVDRGRHQRHDLDGALAVLGLPEIDDAPLVVNLDGALDRGRRLRRAVAGGEGPLVTILPATRSMPGKRYPGRSFAELCRLLREAGARILVAVGPGEESLGRGVAAAGGATLLPTGWPLPDLAGLLAACDAAVGNDSGLTHVAAVVGCPTLTLFGPTDPVRTAPVGTALVRRWDGPTAWPSPLQVAGDVRALLDQQTPLEVRPAADVAAVP